MLCALIAGSTGRVDRIRRQGEKETFVDVRKDRRNRGDTMMWKTTEILKE